MLLSPADNPLPLPDWLALIGRVLKVCILRAGRDAVIVPLRDEVANCLSQAWYVWRVVDGPIANDHPLLECPPQ